MTLVLFGHDLSGTTANRPTNAEIGQSYYDTDVGVLLVCSAVTSGASVWTSTALAAVLTSGLTFTGNTGVNQLTVPDNKANAIQIVSTDAKAYITCITTNSSEAVALGQNTTVAGTVTVTSAGAAALSVGRQGATAPALLVDASTATSATGLSVKSAAAAGGVAVAAISSGTDEGIKLDAKGAGVVTIGSVSTGGVVLGATSVPVTISGPLVAAPGASTAAAGSTTSDATALPAGTARVYPTTAADDTKGVIVSATDKVTGRMIHIGNGVSNKILKVYPPSGGTINGAAGDAAFSSASGKGVIMYCLSSGSNTWLAW